MHHILMYIVGNPAPIAAKGKKVTAQFQEWAYVDLTDFFSNLNGDALTYAAKGFPKGSGFQTDPGITRLFYFFWLLILFGTYY